MKPPSAAAVARRAKLGTASLAVFGLAAIWSAACALWIQSRLPSESALPIIGLLCVGLAVLTAFGMLCALLGLFLSHARRWVAVAGLLLNSSPWIFFLWTVVRDRLRHM